MINKRIAVLWIVALAMTSLAWGDVWEDLAAYQYGKEPNPAKQIETLLQDGPHGPVEGKLIEVIAADEATQTGKALACRYLQRVGSPRCVPALAGLLPDELLSDYARLVLERLACEPADQALRQALTTAPDTAKIGILGSLAERRDQQAVKLASKLATRANPSLARAAIQALGKIAGKEAAQELSSMTAPEELVPDQMQALIACAESLSGQDAFPLCEKVLVGPDIACRIAALRIMTDADAVRASPQLFRAILGTDPQLYSGALDIVAHSKDRKLTYVLLDFLHTLPPQRKAALMIALGTRGDEAATMHTLSYLKAEDPEVQVAAVKASARIGNAVVVEPLLHAVQGSTLKETVIQAVAAMPDDGVDAALIDALHDPRLRALAMQILAIRGCTEAVPELLKLVKDRDPDTRKQAWASLAVLGDERHMDAMMVIVLGIKDSQDLSHAGAAFRKVFARARDKSKCFRIAAGYAERATDAIKGVILEMGALSGDSYALEIERQALASGNSGLAGIALRVLTKWPNELAADDLLQQAKAAPQSVEGIIALRGYIRIAGLASATVSNDDRMKMLDTATALAERDDEKKQIINSLQQVTNLEALERLKDYLDDPALQAEAEIATSKLIWKIRRRHPQEVTPIAERLRQSKNRKVTEQARRTLNDLAKPGR